MKEAPPACVLLDVRLPGTDGLTSIGQMREHVPTLPVIVMTAFGNLGTAVGAIAGGAFDYLLKPFDVQQAIDAVGRAVAAPIPRPRAWRPTRMMKS